jgi:DNA repair exonuclease SbcCD ATPase subunit
MRTLQRLNKLLSNKTALEKQTPRLHNALATLEKGKEAAYRYLSDEINNYFNKTMINQIYSRIEPHPELKAIDFRSDLTDKGPRLEVFAQSKDERLNPALYLSAGQINVLSLSVFLAKAFEMGSDEISTIFMDDPVQNLSDINILSFIDLIRSVITLQDKQLVISTHDENFFKLIQNKLPSGPFDSIYYELTTFGKLNVPV